LVQYAVMTTISDKIADFISRRYETLSLLTIWTLAAIPGLVVSIQRGDDWYASLIVMVIQTMASFGSITMFGIITQLVCYHWIESVEVHEHMTDGLFFGFHAGLVIWILYAFYAILFGVSIPQNINVLIAFFGVTSLLSCVVGIIIGFLLGKYKQSKNVIQL
jgi:hypothetical protein